MEEEYYQHEEFIKYLDTIGVEKISLIGEKSFKPIIFIIFKDGTEEECYFSPEEIQHTYHMDFEEIGGWKYFLSKSKRLKNKL